MPGGVSGVEVEEASRGLAQVEPAPSRNLGEKTTTDLVHMRVRHNGCIAYKTSTVASVIIVTEFCERLAYYGLGGSLVLFFQTRLNMSNAAADVNYSAWSGMCYVTPLLGGYIADSRLGRYNTIVIFSSIYLVGLSMLTAVSAPDYTYHGLVMLALYIIALGTGGIKPNVCTLGADQFDDRIEEERDAKASYFSWFYFSINFGAAFAYTFVSYISQYGMGQSYGGVEWGFFYGFMIPTISMFVGIAAFVAGKHTFGYAGSGRVSSPDSNMGDSSSHSGGSDMEGEGGGEWEYEDPSSSHSGGENTHAHTHPESRLSRRSRSSSTNPLLNASMRQRQPQGGLPFHPDEIRREINRERFMKKQRELDAAAVSAAAEERRQSELARRESGVADSDADVHYNSNAEAAPSHSTDGRRDLTSAWEDERANEAYADSEEHQPFYDDETLSRWHEEFVSKDSEFGPGGAAATAPSQSEVSVLFSVMMQGLWLWAMDRAGWGSGKFISPDCSASDTVVVDFNSSTAWARVGAGDAFDSAERDGQGEGEGDGVAMVDFSRDQPSAGAGASASTVDRSSFSPTVSAQQPQPQAETQHPSASAQRVVHVLDYACLDNYPQTGGLNLQHATPDELRRGVRGSVPGQGHYTAKDVRAAKMVTRLLPFLGVFVLFWTIYSQMSVGFQNQGCQMNLHMSAAEDSAKIPISALNLFDTLAILIIVPIVDKLVYPWIKQKYGAAPSLLARIKAGFYLSVVAMVVAGVVEHARKQHLPQYDYQAGQGYYADPVARANTSPCANIDEYNPAYFGAWWQFNHARKVYDGQLARNDYVLVDGFRLFGDSPAPAFCQQTCGDTFFSNANVETNNPFSTLHLNSTCISCDPLPQVSSVSVLWQIPQFCLIGAAEVLASIGSLEFFYSQAPPQFRSVVQSFNLATTALGSLLVIPLILIVNSGGGDKAFASPSSQGSTGGGMWVPADLNYGHLDFFFYLLAALMMCNCVVLHRTSAGYDYQTDASMAAALKS